MDKEKAADYYLAAMAMHIKGRYKHNTAIRSIYAALEDAEMMAEHLRVLYVAMTRAKEKLILTGVIRGADRLLAKYAYVEDMEPLLLPYNVRKNADSYAKHLLACYGFQPGGDWDTSLGGVFEGVGEQVVKYLLDFVAVEEHVDAEGVRLEGVVDASLPGVVAEGRVYLLPEGGDVAHAEAEFHLVVVDLAQPFWFKLKPLDENDALIR